MTFKEAVEYYQDIEDEIDSIRNTVGPILKQDNGPLGEYHISTKDIAQITVFLNNYIRTLEDKLDEEIK